MRDRKKPRIFYGWVVVSVALVTMAVVYGIRFSFSIFYVAILEDFDWSRASTAGIYSLNILSYGLSAPIAGFLVDRWGPRKVIPLGAAVLALGTAACSLANALWQFYFLFGIVVGFGTACAGYVPHSTIVSNWFVRRRATALGISLAGIGASFLLGALAQVMISDMGWRQAYIVLAVATVAIVIPITVLFQRHRPEDMGLSPDGESPEAQRRASLNPGHAVTGEAILDREWASREWTLSQALRTRRFWFLFFASFAMFGIGLQLLMAHQIAFMVDVGYSEAFAATIYGLFGVLVIAGRFCGFICDWIGREQTYALGGGTAILAVFLLLLVRDTSYPWLLFIYVLLLGFSIGIIPIAQAAIAADLFQGRSFGLINGAITVGLGLGGAVGPWMGGYIFDTTHSYRPALLLVLSGILLSVALVWLAAPRKVRQVVKKAPGIPP